jgi:hypothetical protein
MELIACCVLTTCLQSVSWNSRQFLRFLPNTHNAARPARAIRLRSCLGLSVPEKRAAALMPRYRAEVSRFEFFVVWNLESSVNARQR